MLVNIKKLRENRRITQQQLAAAVGVSQQSINKYENHDVEPDLSTLIAIADYFYVTVDYLIGHVMASDKNSKMLSLSSDEIALINDYRFLSPKEKESILMILDNYKNK